MALLDTLTALAAANTAATDLVYVAVSPFNAAADRKQDRTNFFAQVPVPITAGKPSTTTGVIGIYSANNAELVAFTVDTPAASLNYILPNASPTAGQILSASAPSGSNVTLTWVAQTAATSPAGANTQVQFNDAGAFGASANLTWVSPTLTIGVANSTTGNLTLTNSAGTTTTTHRAGNAASTLAFVWPVVDPSANQVLSASAPAGGVVTLAWATPAAATTPGGANTQLQYNNAGAFGGISGATSNGTATTFSSGNLLATSPRITTGINDANNLPIILLTATASAVNQITVANNATTVAAGPTITTTGSDTDINLTVDLAGVGYLRYLGPHILLNGGAGSLSNLLYVGSDSSGSVNASFGFFVGGVGSNSANDGPYFLGRGNSFTNVGNQQGSLIFVAGNRTGSQTDGCIRFLSNNETEQMRITNAGYVVVKSPTSAIADAALIASSVSFSVDEGANLLTFKVKYSDGTTIKSGTVVLV